MLKLTAQVSHARGEKLLSPMPESNRGILRVNLQKTLNQRSTKNDLI